MSQINKTNTQHSKKIQVTSTASQPQGNRLIRQDSNRSIGSGHSSLTERTPLTYADSDIIGRISNGDKTIVYQRGVIKEKDETISSLGGALDYQTIQLQEQQAIASHNLAVGLADRQRADYIESVAGILADQTIIQEQVINQQAQVITETVQRTKAQKNKLKKLKKRAKVAAENNEKLKQEEAQKNALKKIVQKQSKTTTQKELELQAVKQSKADLEKNRSLLNQKIREADEAVKQAEQIKKAAEEMMRNAQEAMQKAQEALQKATAQKTEAENEDLLLNQAIAQAKIESQNISTNHTTDISDSEKQLKQLKLKAGIKLDYDISYKLIGNKVEYKINTNNFENTLYVNLDGFIDNTEKEKILNNLQKIQINNKIDPDTKEAKAECEEFVYNLAKLHTQVRIDKGVVEEEVVYYKVFDKKEYPFQFRLEYVIDETFENNLKKDMKKIYGITNNKNIIVEKRINNAIKTLLKSLLDVRKNSETKRIAAGDVSSDFAYIKTEYQKKFK